MMIKINALGEACPLPVIKAKKALRENSEIVIAVDNEIATQNLKKMGLQLGFQVEVTQESDKVYYVAIFGKDAYPQEESYMEEDFYLQGESYTKGDSNPEEEPYTRRESNQERAPHFHKKPYIVVIASKTMGAGNDELGQTLLKAFIYSLTEQDVLPTHMLFYNEGAKLTTDYSPVLQDLETLNNANVEILTCGACLDYFDLKEKLVVGEVTNMYRILELMSRTHVVRP